MVGEHSSPAGALLMIHSEHEASVQSCAGVNRIAADCAVKTSVPVGPWGHPKGPPLLKIVVAEARQHMAKGMNKAARAVEIMDHF